MTEENSLNVSLEDMASGAPTKIEPADIPDEPETEALPEEAYAIGYQDGYKEGFDGGWGSAYNKGHEIGWDMAMLATRKSTLDMIIKALSDSPIVTVAGKGGALEFLRGVRGDLEE